MQTILNYLWLIFQPSNALLIMAASGGVLIWLGRRRIGGWLVLIATSLTLAIMIFPVSDGPMIALENRFPQPQLPAHIDGIITLGGAVNPATSAHWHQTQLSERAERLFEAANLALQYPEATIAATGGTWAGCNCDSEAAYAATILEQMGVDGGRVIIETKARSTYENGVLTRQLVAPKPGETWVLITSAFHMPRSVGVFRKIGWDVIPYPVDYYTSEKLDYLRAPNLSRSLVAIDYVAREWAALTAYWLLGRTDTLFPGPVTSDSD